MRSLLGTVIEEEFDVTVVDMEAGLEHLSRSGGTLAYADALLVVVEPTRKAVLTAVRTRDLANELGISTVYAVANKTASPDDERFVRQLAAEDDLHVVAVVPEDPVVADADRSGGPLFGRASSARVAVEALVEFLANELRELNRGDARR